VGEGGARVAGRKSTVMSTVRERKKRERGDWPRKW
jgi:hypothetical protein